LNVSKITSVKDIKIMVRALLFSLSSLIVKGGGTNEKYSRLVTSL